MKRQKPHKSDSGLYYVTMGLSLIAIDLTLIAFYIWYMINPG